MLDWMYPSSKHLEEPSVGGEIQDPTQVQQSWLPKVQSPIRMVISV
jgi:hypothetical protein